MASHSRAAAARGILGHGHHTAEGIKERLSFSVDLLQRCAGTTLRGGRSEHSKVTAGGGPPATRHPPGGRAEGGGSIACSSAQMTPNNRICALAGSAGLLSAPGRPPP